MDPDSTAAYSVQHPVSDRDPPPAYLAIPQTRTCPYWHTQIENARKWVMRYAGAAARAGIIYRMDETNSLSGHGKFNVSDTLAAALWVVEHSLVVMQAGGQGVNFHDAGCRPYSPILFPGVGGTLTWWGGWGADGAVGCTDATVDGRGVHLALIGSTTLCSSLQQGIILCNSIPYNIHYNSMQHMVLVKCCSYYKPVPNWP